MSRCSKVPNPCKICLGTVTQKTGLQCQGACQSWVHYSCLHYTPGKISDIKAGIICVTCPCPDCKTILPKEIRTDAPYTCNNTQCPANLPPKCDNVGCPSNDIAVAKTQMNQTQTNKTALSKCGTDCKEYTAPLKLPIMPPESSSECLSDNKCDLRCLSADDMPGDARRNVAQLPSLNTMEQMCNTVGQLTNQINDLMNIMKQAVHQNGGENGAGCVPNRNKNCSQAGPKSLCPKPCYCPGNPARRK